MDKSKRMHDKQRMGSSFGLRCTYVMLLVSIAVLAGTSMNAITSGEALRGWSLWVHVVTAGLFLIALGAISLMWAFAGFIVPLHVNQPQTAPTVGTVASGNVADFNSAAMRFAGLCMLAAGLATGLTILLSMVPRFSTHGMRLLLEVHRYSGLSLVLITIIHLVLNAVRRLRRWMVEATP
jgi:hypothetical protein